jgi:hypothetical protein
MNRAWCHVCRATVDTFVTSAAKEVVVPAITTALIGGALAHRGRRNATFEEVAGGAILGALAGVAINAASHKAQDLFCGTCRTHLRHAA